MGNSNVYRQGHINTWNDNFGKNFTDNVGDVHTQRMIEKNIETGGAYQAAVSGAYGEFTISAIFKSLPEGYHIMNDILMQQGAYLRPYNPEKYGQSPFRIVRKKGRLYEVVKKSTQLDHLIVSPYGVFVIETKNHKGWVFGDVNGKVWTQTLKGMNNARAYGGTDHYTFYNPLKQNMGHMEELAKQVRLNSTNMVGMIVFTNPEAFLGNVNCNCVYTLDMLYEGITKFTNQIWTIPQTEKVIRLIERVDSNSYTAAKEHEAYVQDIKRRHEININLKIRKGSY